MSTDKTESVVIRDAKAEDVNFILATWLRGLYYGDSWFKEMPKDVFMSTYEKIIKAMMLTPGVSVKVACLSSDPDTIVGYAVAKNDTLYWCYVKSNWRKIGIMKSLVSKDTKVVTHLTRLGLTLLRKYSQVHFNPFKL